jgi:predicted NUDIX family NTP pyrophosphohydrolase
MGRQSVEVVRPSQAQPPADRRARAAQQEKRKRRTMPKRSAGILIYRRRGGGIELLLVHPGGPFWARKDEGAWSIPKGEYAEGEDPAAVARRELEEETGMRIDGDLLPLGEVVQAGRKHVTAFALEGDLDPLAVRSNMFELEWPPRSGRRQQFPEVDRAQWFSPAEARQKILPAQAQLITRLFTALGMAA